MCDQLKIYCVNLRRHIDMEGGRSLLDLARHLAPELGFDPICARVNNKTESLRYNVYQPKMVEFLPATRQSGVRVYERSLCMLLYAAIRRRLPGIGLKVEHSISRGYFCRLKGLEMPDRGILDDIEKEMRRMVAADLPYERFESLTADVVDMFAEQGLESKIELLRTVHDLYTVYYRLNGVCDSYYGALAPSTGYIGVFDLHPMEGGFLLTGIDPEHPGVSPEPVAQPKMFEAFTDYQRVNHIIGIHDVGELNRAVDRDAANELVNLAETMHERKLALIADNIAARYREGGARIVLIAGPSSSGKTTTTKRLALQLMANSLKPKLISLDDYFVDRRRTPLAADGDYDYESLYALDLEQFNNDLNAILEGIEVELPTYDFATGTRRYRGNRVRLEQGSVLLIEGIHGLNPELTAHIRERMKYRLYVSALTTLAIDDHNRIPTTDNRLLRRIVRDHKYRGISAVETIRRWPSVRRGEEKWIFPYQENADAVFNSSLLYELSVLKDRGEDILRQVPRDVVEYAEAYRLRKFLSYFRSIPVDKVPSTSILREFLGGSSFHY